MEQQLKNTAFVVYKGIDQVKKRRQIEVVPFDPELKYLQKLVGGYIEHFIIDEGLNQFHIDMWIDEEGKFKEGLTPSFALMHDGQLYDVIFGNCVFSKYDGQGETFGLSLDEVNIVIKYLMDRDVVGLIKKDGSTVPALAVAPYAHY